MTNPGPSPRKLAVMTLTEILEKGAYSELVMNRMLKLYKEESLQSRRFYTKLVYTTLIHLEVIDEVIGSFSNRPLGSLKAYVVNTLRIGACQLLYLSGVKAYAAINESVNLIKYSAYQNLAGYVNAVLRSILREKEGLGDLSRMPAWLLEIFSKSYGEERAGELWRRMDSEKKLCVRLTEKGKAQGGADLLAAYQPTQGSLVKEAFYLEVGAGLAESEAYQQGLVTIQDESSMAAALSLEVERGESVLDLCAAPGGKTCLLAEKAGREGRVVARELHPHRAQLIEKQTERLSLPFVEVCVGDSTKKEPAYEGAFQKVLLDAPCSGLGMIRSKPDILCRNHEEEIDSLAQLQKALLECASGYVKEGGMLVYSTCTLNKTENEDQIKAFLEAHPEFQPLPPLFHEEDSLESPWGMTLLPQEEGHEGFFISRLLKKEGGA